jgi:hypothetical protein
MEIIAQANHIQLNGTQGRKQQKENVRPKVVQVVKVTAEEEEHEINENM